MEQKIITPDILNCSCGASAKVITSGKYEDVYKVICENKHTLTKYCGTRHRAICRWNHRVKVGKELILGDM